MMAYKPARPEQYEALLDLTLGAAGYLEPTLRQMDLTEAEFGRLFRRVGRVTVIYEGEAIAGYYWWERRNDILHLHGLILYEAFRGRGIGTAVLERLAEVHGKGMSAIELGVHQSNTAAIRLYRRLGYRTVKELTDLGFLVMQKALA